MRTTLCAMYSIYIVLLSIIDSGFCGLTCLTCDDVALPSLCTSIDKCGPDEFCGLEQYVTAIGSIRYRQRCIDKLSCPLGKHSSVRRADRTYRSSSSVICKSCCDQNLCNSGGCGLKAFADDEADHLCYSCDTQIGHNMCNSIQQCGRDQICRIEPLVIPGAPKNLFRSHCVHKQACTTPSIIGRRRSTCDSCCNGSLCNDFDPTKTCSHSTSHTTVPVTVSTTPVPTVTTTIAAATVTTTTAQTTTKATHTTQGSHLPVGDCHDVQPTCLGSFCTIPTYHQWAFANCRKSCGLCGGIAPVSSGTVGPATATTHKTTTPSSTGGSVGTSTGPHIISSCTDITAGCRADLHCNNKDYLQWSSQNCRKTCKICTEHTSPIEKGDLYLMLKAVSGVVAPDIYELWKESRTINSHIPAFADYKNTFKGHFKPDFSNHWAQNAFDKVTLSMYINGTEKAFITFNATGTDKLSWFRADRIINSTWAGHLSANNNMTFEMQKNSATGFEFNAGDSTSCSSKGWMTIVTSDSCVRDSSMSLPAFLFCPNTSPCSWKDGQFVSAEVLAIHAHATA